VRRWLRSLNPNLPRPVQLLQLGGLCNAFGNGIVLPFMFIYLHNVRGVSLGMAGLVLATNAGVSLISGPVAGALVDRVGGKRMLGTALAFLALGTAAFAFVHEPWQAFLAATVTGIGNGLFWPSQSTLLFGLVTPAQRTATAAMQRVVMNLGIGLGALVAGFVATTSDPRTFELLFVVDGATFVVYLLVLAAFVPQPPRGGHHHARAAGGYETVVRDRAFMGLLAINTLFIFAGFAGFELLPPYAKNEASVSEQAIGIVFFVNTVVIVLAQLPIAKLTEGHRRMRTLALLGIVWAGAWLLVPLAGLSLEGATAAMLLCGAMAVFAVGECLHGAVYAPLVADLADPRLLGRYMALSALSWQLGFTLGPAAGGFALELTPNGTWLAAAAICLATGAAALALERALPQAARRTPDVAAASQAPA
jgi:MFS family permease